MVRVRRCGRRFVVVLTNQNKCATCLTGPHVDWNAIYGKVSSAIRAEADEQEESAKES